MVVPGKIFQSKGFQKVGKRYFEIGFCKQNISQESHFGNLLTRIYRRCMRHSFHPESTKGPPWLGLVKKFQNISSKMAENRYFDIGFCKYSKYFLYTL